MSSVPPRPWQGNAIGRSYRPEDDGVYESSAKAACAELDRRFGHILREIPPLGAGPPTRGSQRTPPDAPMFTTRRLDQVTPRAVPWLWPGWLARGTMAMFDGDGGLGKSTITADLAARVTRGLEMPSGGPTSLTGKPAAVLILSAEDDPEFIIRPRLEAAGADMSLCHLGELTLGGEAVGLPSLPGDLARLEEMIRAHGVALVVIDPLMSYLDARIDSHRDQDIRRVTSGIKIVAQNTKATFILIRHLNKGAGPALYRGGGSVGFVNSARTSWIVGIDPSAPQINVLAMNKTNLGRHPRSLTYAIEEVPWSYGDEKGETTRIKWGRETSLGKEDILRPADPKPVGAKAAAEAWLRDLLTNKPLPQKEVLAAASREGISERTLDRAKKALDVRARRQDDQWVWHLEGEGCQGCQDRQG